MNTLEEMPLGMRSFRVGSSRELGNIKFVLALDERYYDLYWFLPNFNAESPIPMAPSGATGYPEAAFNKTHYKRIYDLNELFT